MKKGLPVHKPTIGFQITNLYEEYPSKLWPGIVDFYQERNTNLIIFAGEALNFPYGYEYQSNIIYQHIQPNNLDALIMASGTLCNYIDKTEFKDFYSHFRPLPLVSISIPIEGVPSVLVDNQHGMFELVRHMVQVHHSKRIAFIHGPDTNQEAKDRYKTYCDALKQYGLELDPNLVVFGDFVMKSGSEAVRILLDERKVVFDTIISSNDDMAYGAIQELTSRGIKVPRQIAVVGFDDLEESEFFLPALTTVRQPFYEQGVRAAEMALDLINGKKVKEQIILPTELVVRTSCGCLMHDMIILENNYTKMHDNPAASLTIEQQLIELIMQQTSDILEKKDLSRKEKHNTMRDVQDFAQFLLLEKQTGKYESNFLEKIYEILNRYLEKGVDISPWQNIFTMMENALSDFFEKVRPDINKTIRNGFQKAVLLTGELMKTGQAVNRIHLERKVATLRELIHRIVSTLKIEGLVDILRQELPRFGIQSSYLVTYRKAIPHKRGMKWKMPPRLELLMRFTEQTGISSVYKQKVIFTSDYLLPQDMLPVNRQFIMVVRPLYFMEDQLGYIIYELADKGRSIYEILSSQISSALKSALLYKARERSEKKLREALMDLEFNNQQLKSLSQKDELTGLYNRRGFLALASQNLSLAVRMRKNGVLIYADLDGLKKVNDTFGHDEGDAAIKAAASVLKYTFRHVDIIARIGGDEFTVLVIDTAEDYIQVLKERLKKNIDTFNDAVSKPYQLSISLGWTNFNYQDDVTLDTLMNLADSMLYTDKRQKKAGRQPT